MFRSLQTEYLFDRLLPEKLAQAYELPRYVRKTDTTAAAWASRASPEERLGRRDASANRRGRRLQAGGLPYKA